MKKLGLIQPGKIGDIIICLPIAKYYSEQGYEVIWPVDRHIINNFIDYVDYVTFVPVEFDCTLAHEACKKLECDRVIDVSFTIPGASASNSNYYLTQDQFTFDEFKYFLGGVPFEQKWTLDIKRNPEKEKILFDYLNINTPYVIVQENSSDYVRRVEWTNPDIRRIDIVNFGDSIFDWLYVLEKAEQHILIESCFTNLIDQLKISVNKNIILSKNGYYGKPLRDGRLRGEPVLKLNWQKA